MASQTPKQRKEVIEIDLKTSPRRKASRKPNIEKPKTLRKITQPALNKVIGYEEKGGSSLASASVKSPREETLGYKFKAQVLEYILSHFEIDQDFENSSRFGAKSGSCFEERVLAAFMNDLLELKPGKVAQKMCFECGKLGHFPVFCPDGL